MIGNWIPFNDKRLQIVYKVVDKSNKGYVVNTTDYNWSTLSYGVAYSKWIVI